jgi:hypothetical protein
MGRSRSKQILETAETDAANRFHVLANPYLHVFGFGSTLILVPARPPPWRCAADCTGQLYTLQVHEMAHSTHMASRRNHRPAASLTAVPPPLSPRHPNSGTVECTRPVRDEQGGYGGGQYHQSHQELPHQELPHQGACPAHAHATPSSRTGRSTGRDSVLHHLHGTARTSGGAHRASGASAAWSAGPRERALGVAAR